MQIYKPEQVGALKDLAESIRQAGGTVCMANGAFDLFHVGHLRYLQGARASLVRYPGPHLLVVAVNSDVSVKASKGASRPMIAEQERAEIVAGIGGVDAVVIFEETTAHSVLEMVRPNLHAKGTDYTKETVPEAEWVQSWGGEVIIVGDPKNHSTTALMAKLDARPLLI